MFCAIRWIYWAFVSESSQSERVYKCFIPEWMKPLFNKSSGENLIFKEPKQKTFQHEKHSIVLWILISEKDMRKYPSSLKKANIRVILWNEIQRICFNSVMMLELFDIKTKSVCLFSDVCGDLAPSLLSGDVPEAAVPSGEGKRETPPPPPSSPLHCSIARLSIYWLTTSPPPHHPHTSPSSLCPVSEGSQGGKMLSYSETGFWSLVYLLSFKMLSPWAETVKLSTNF